MQYLRHAQHFIGLLPTGLPGCRVAELQDARQRLLQVHRDGLSSQALASFWYAHLAPTGRLLGQSCVEAAVSNSLVKET